MLRVAAVAKAIVTSFVPIGGETNVARRAVNRSQIRLIGHPAVHAANEAKHQTAAIESGLRRAITSKR